jgi:hypothetical protein
MDSEPLVNDQLEAGATFIDLLRQHYPVEAAFWLKATAEDRWRFYVASAEWDKEVPQEAIVTAFQLIRAMPLPKLDWWPLRLIAANDPLAQSAATYCRLHPSQKPRYERNFWLGRIYADEAYLYPLSAVSPTQPTSLLPQTVP